jgi:Protein of unknown function (DUF1566)
VLVCLATFLTCVAAAVSASPALVLGCVAGVSASNPNSVYTVAGASVTTSGTVTDERTGLMWEQCARGLSGAACTNGSATSFTWQAALAAVTSANSVAYLGYTDWRLPNVRELRSLVEECRLSPSINEVAFPATPAAGFWSSSPRVAAAATGAWVVSFASGASGNGVRTATNNLRLVRGGQ